VDAQAAAQVGSGGTSSNEVLDEILRQAPDRFDSWLDIGCGTGDLLRVLAARYSRADLVGNDILPWLPAELHGRVGFRAGPAEALLVSETRFDVVSLIEVLEHLEAPWSVLRVAAQLVAPGGTLIASTPNIATLRSRLEFGLCGRLTAFRPEHPPHMTPIIPHVATRLLAEEGLTDMRVTYACTDVVPHARGRRWPEFLVRAQPRLSLTSVVITAARRP
jgi:SAM-dependent methyltransferase